MPLELTSMRPGTALQNVTVFLSASIPDPNRWSGTFDPLEITDAVTAAARAVLTESGILLTAVHPTIAPLLLYVVGEFPTQERPSIVVYQSHLFDETLPEATRRFARSGAAVFRWTEAAPGESPQADNWHGSLAELRQTMLRENAPAAAIFIGGMEGIADEHLTFANNFPERPWYALGRPGGVARELASQQRARLRDHLLNGDVYPALFRRVVRDIAASLPLRG